MANLPTFLPFIVYDDEHTTGWKNLRTCYVCQTQKRTKRKKGNEVYDIYHSFTDEKKRNWHEITFKWHVGSSGV